MKKHTAKLCIKAFSIMTFVLLGVYSAAMAAIELCMGKDHITGYFSDIVAGNDYPLFHKVMYGMNTSIGVAVLTVIAALFLVCVSIRQYTSVSSARPWFECSQVLFFLFAACDERFMIHEKLGQMTHVDDSVYVGLLGVVEIVLLVYPGRVVHQPWRLKAWLLPVSFCVVISAGLDAAFPTRISELTTFEDLAKLWGMVFMLIYAWKYCQEIIQSAIVTPAEVA